MKYYDDVPVWGDPVDQGALDQIIRCKKTADYALLCADHHKGYSVPIGGTVAYEDKISPSAVGFDQACGNLAVRLDLQSSDIKGHIDVIMDTIFREISFGVGRTNNTKVDHPIFERDWDHPAISGLKSMARDQLGTIGSGNHYVDIFEDENGYAWIGVHFGSRGLGHKTTTWFLNATGTKDSMDADPLVLDAKSDLGAGFIECFSFTSEYAYAGRDWVCDKVADIIGAKIVEKVHNNHNGIWRETHFGKDYWVVRKGATPAFPGQRGFVGGSMGEDSVILEGVDSEESKLALYSTVHGAGRVMSRTAALGKFVKDKQGKKQRTEGLVSHDATMMWLNDSEVCLRGGGLDESPFCYKRLDEVLTHHQNSVKILHRLRPLGVAMAGKDIKDPYKD